MIYSARDRDELETFWTIVLTAYYHARGLSMDPMRATAVSCVTLGQVKRMRLKPTQATHVPSEMRR